MLELITYNVEPHNIYFRLANQLKPIIIKLIRSIAFFIGLENIFIHLCQGG